MGKDQMHCSTNAISLLSAFIFPRHFKYYFFGILVFSLESNTICQNWVTKKRQVGWMCCCLSSRTRAFAGRSKTQKLFLFTSVGGTNSPTSATDTLRLCFTIFLRISGETLRWQISHFFSRPCHRRHSVDLHQIGVLFGHLNSESTDITKYVNF